MTPGKRPTIRDVAEAAGVSTQTVSRVLNNHPDVAPDTFRRVQQVIAETGYAPNMLARSLTQGRTRIISVIAYGLEYFGPSRVLTGIEPPREGSRRVPAPSRSPDRDGLDRSRVPSSSAAWSQVPGGERLPASPR